MEPVRRGHLVQILLQFGRLVRDVPDLLRGAKLNEHAISLASGDSTAYVIYRGILGAYSSTHNGQRVMYWIGYRSANRATYSSGVYKQMFQNGYILYFTSNCQETSYWLNETLTPPRYRAISTTYYCDAK